MRKVLAVAASGLLGLGVAACGGDDGGGSAAAFCDLARAYDEEYADAEPDDTEAVEALRRLRNAAPGEIRAEVDKIVEVFERLGEIDDDDFEAQAEVFASIEGLEEAGTKVERYLADECGIESDDDFDDDLELDDLELDDDFGLDESDDDAGE